MIKNFSLRSSVVDMSQVVELVNAFVKKYYMDGTLAGIVTDVNGETVHYNMYDAEGGYVGTSKESVQYMKLVVENG